MAFNPYNHNNHNGYNTQRSNGYNNNRYGGPPRYRSSSKQTNPFLSQRCVVSSNAVLEEVQKLKQQENGKNNKTNNNNTYHTNNKSYNSHKNDIIENNEKQCQQTQNTVNEYKQYKQYKAKTKAVLQQQKDQLIAANKQIQELQPFRDEVNKLKADLKEALYQNQLLQNEVLLKQQDEEKKEERVQGLKEELIFLAQKMNEFNTKYDKQLLSAIYTDDPDALFVEQDINNTQLCCKSLTKQLQDIKHYVISVTKPDVNAYKSWDINTTIIWIKSLDDGKFSKYCDALRKGFESDKIPVSELQNIGQSDLATDPFNIRIFMDRKKLAQYFKSLGQHEVADADEGGQTAYIG